jgi:hypothetical protein
MILPGLSPMIAATAPPKQIADLIEDWFQDGAADGFRSRSSSSGGCSGLNTRDRCCASITACPGQKASSTILPGQPSRCRPLPAYDRRPTGGRATAIEVKRSSWRPMCW